MQHDVGLEDHPTFGDSGADPVQEQPSIQELSARIRQLEEQARKVSAPFLIESALREAGELRSQSIEAAERTYNDAVQAAEQEAHRILEEAEKQAAQTIVQAEAEGRRRIDEILAHARQEAAAIRASSIEQEVQTHQELERVSAEFGQFIKRLLDRSSLDSTVRTPAGESSAAPVLLAPPPPASAPAPVEEPVAAPTLSVEPAPASAPGPTADWSDDWSEQFKGLTPPEAPETPATPSADPKPAAPAREPFKLPSWLPS